MVHFLTFVGSVALTHDSPVTHQLGYTALQVNWLGNIANCAYLVVAFLIPIISRRLGMRYTVCHTRTCYRRFSHSVQICIGTLLLLLSTWIRYAGTAGSLSSGSSYTLVILGQVCAYIRGGRKHQIERCP